jgi:hypothetical protein
VALSLFRNRGRKYLLLAVCAGSSAYASSLWTNALPSNGNTGYDAAPVYGSLCDENKGACPGAPNEPYILGDQFTLSGSSNTINSVTIYEVAGVPTTATGIPGDGPGTEFSNLSLYIAPDSDPSGMGAAVDTLSGASALGAASSQVCYSGACGGGGVNFESIYTPGEYFAIYSVTFSGLNLAMGAGLYDFAIGATPIGGNSFALLTSDPNHSGTSVEDSASLSPNGFLFYFYDGSGGSPLATYQYVTSPPSIIGYDNGADVNVLITGSSSAPEPSSFGLLGIGLAGIWAGLRRRNHRHARRG